MVQVVLWWSGTAVNIIINLNISIGFPYEKFGYEGKFPAPDWSLSILGFCGIQ